MPPCSGFFLEERSLPLNLDPGTFGGTSACHILVEKLNEVGDERFANAVIRRFTQYFETLGELMKLNNPSRDVLMKLLFDQTVQEAEEILKPRFEEHGVPFSYFHNILTHRRRQAHEHGLLLEKFRGEDKDHNEILLALRGLAKAQSGH
jgi:hypothetical protein